MYVFRVRYQTARPGFTLVEVAAALVILSVMIVSTVILMNRYVGAVIDLRLREHAFEMARSNMEMLLTEARIQEMTEYGTSEEHPDIDWEMIVEPFYEPVTERMWIRAICTAGFFDSQGDRQDVELEHWITSLTAEQIKLILAQQDLEQEYLDLLEDGELTERQKVTRAFLEQKGLDVKAYDDFLERQRREKLKYLSENGMDDWDQFLIEMEEKEDIFLDKLGMNFDEYNKFAMEYVPPEDEENTIDEPILELENLKPDDL